VPDVFARTRRWALEGATTQRWRERRYELFVELCAVRPGETILDVGAGGGHALARFNANNPIVALDLPGAVHASALTAYSNVSQIEGDATAMPFADREFPLAFSNSVIEHVGDWKAQQRFADEVRRVADRYFVQTPNKWFPIEPHYQLPLMQFAPPAMERWMRSRRDIGWVAKNSTPEIRLLSARELRQLFPDAIIYRERLGGLTKSLMAVRGPTSDQSASAR
jgi:SAM-dependent methyltransferase